LNQSAAEVAAKFTKAITFPDVVLQLDGMLNDGVSNTTDFALLISRDTALTATLLKFANSPLYGFSGQVATVDRAVSLIGMREIRDLVLSVAIKTTFDKVSTETISLADFWRHSLCCALACRRIAELAHHSQREVLFTAGLLHDIGQFAMFDQIPDACSEVLLKSRHRSDDVETFELEREIIGFDHNDVGLEIAKKWRFPEILQDCIEYHHLPEEAPQHHSESAIVHVGNAMAVMVEQDMDGFSNAPPISSEALAVIGLELDQLWPMIPQIRASFQDSWPVFGVAA